MHRESAAHVTCVRYITAQFSTHELSLASYTQFAVDAHDACETMSQRVVHIEPTYWHRLSETHCDRVTVAEQFNRHRYDTASHAHLPCESLQSARFE